MTMRLDSPAGQRTHRRAVVAAEAAPRAEIICTSRDHPIWPHLVKWAKVNRARLVTSSSELTGAPILFLVSCSEIIGPAIRNRYRATLVLHASDLPNGRGWSPHIWSILEGKSSICVSLLEAAEPVDTGDIWDQRWIELDGSELYDEINDRLFAAELDLMSGVIAGRRSGHPQAPGGSSYRRRMPEDSRLDPDKSVADQFDPLRVCDPDRFPAFVDLRGHRYLVRVTKA